MRSINFISYSGTYPNLCSGELVLEIAGKIKTFSECLSSGGSASFTEDWDEVVVQGEWSLIEDSFKTFTQEEKEYITTLVNNNIGYGCCGGCV